MYCVPLPSFLVSIREKNIVGVTFLQEQANESLQHALQAGEFITGFEGHPSQKISNIEENHDHSVLQILTESLEHEMNAVSKYKEDISFLHMQLGGLDKQSQDRLLTKQEQLEFLFTWLKQLIKL